MSVLHQTDVPAGLRLRPYAGEQDLPAIVEINNAENAADGIPERETVEDQAAWFSHPNEHFDPARDVVLAEVDGRPVGAVVGQWVDRRDDDLREHRLWGVVHPDWRRRGIGTALHREGERRAIELASTHQTDRGRVLAMFVGEGQLGARAIAERGGYEPVRWFFDMVRPHLDDIADAPLPDGLEVRPVGPDRYRQIWEADKEAFRDHWGGRDESEEAYQRWLGSPHLDPTLWLVAFDGDEVAGGVLNAIWPEENAELGIQRGWLDHVFTRRPWRRRGLARALIGRSLVLLRERGMRQAALGVDGENRQGALGLYESAGFAVDQRYIAYRRPMTELDR